MSLMPKTIGSCVSCNHNWCQSIFDLRAKVYGRFSVNNQLDLYGLFLMCFLSALELETKYKYYKVSIHGHCAKKSQWR